MKFGTLRIDKIIGSGMSADIMSFVDFNNKRSSFIVKLFKRNHTADEILHEVSMQTIVSELGLAAKIISYGPDFIVMEYIDGVTLNNYGDNAEKILDTLNDKLDILYDNGIFHGDLHGGNIIISKKDKKDKIYFIDFGQSEYVGHSIPKNDREYVRNISLFNKEKIKDIASKQKELMAQRAAEAIERIKRRKKT